MAKVKKLKLKLVPTDDPLLKTRCELVKDYDDNLLEEAQAMLAVMAENKALGLAANQVGLNKRLIVVASLKQKILPMAVCNPRITATGKTYVTEVEECLSLPEVRVKVRRPTRVYVFCQDVAGKSINFEAKGDFARVVQHEIDHVNGKLITDYKK